MKVALDILSPKSSRYNYKDNLKHLKMFIAIKKHYFSQLITFLNCGF